jgi:hypothetical protein
VGNDTYASMQHAMREDFRVQLSLCKLSDVTRRKESELIDPSYFSCYSAFLPAVTRA